MNISTIFSRLFNKTGTKTLNDITKIDGQIVFTESGELYVDFSDNNRIKISDIVITDDLYSINELDPNKLYFDKSTGIISRYSEEDEHDYPINLETDLTRKINNYEFNSNGEIDADDWNPLTCSGKIIIDKNDKYGFCYNVNGTTLTCILLDNESHDKFEKIKYYGDPFIEITNSSLFTFNESTGAITAFNNNDNLEHVVIPYKINGVKITSISDEVFYECEAIINVIIPNSVTTISYSAFSSCTSLTSITIPDSVTSIDNNAFSNCTSLTSIVIPNSVTSIKYGMFGSCTSLTSITIPDSVTSIEYVAFVDCQLLTSVTIPNSVTSIGESAFESCNKLASVTIPNSVISIGNDAFYNISSNAVFYVDQGSYAEQWCIENNKNYKYTVTDSSLINYQGEISELPENPKPYYSYKLLNNITVDDMEYKKDSLIIYVNGNYQLLSNPVIDSEYLNTSQLDYNSTTGKLEIKSIPGELMGEFDTESGDLKITLVNEDAVTSPIKYIGLTSGKSILVSKNYSSDNIHVYAELYDNYTGRAQNHLVKIEHGTKTYFATSTNTTSINVTLDSATGILTLNNINTSDENLTTIYFSIMSGNYIDSVEVVEDYSAFAITYFSLIKGSSKTINNYDSSKVLVYAELYDGYINQFGMIKIIEGSNTYFGTSTNGTTIDVELTSDGVITLNNINDTDGDDTNNLQKINFILMNVSSPESE